jgi:hypothetical protein
MAFSDRELRVIEPQVQAFIERKRPPVKLRDRVDIDYRIQNQSITVFEIRPVLPEMSRKVEVTVAKATYVRKRKHWRVFWQRANGKWYRYVPRPVVRSVEEFLKLIDMDECGAFRG